MDLKTLDNHIELKTSEVSELEINREKYLSKIKYIEKIIASYHKTFFETFIEIISIGFVKYDKKYSELINENKKTIFELNDSFDAIDENLRSIKKEIIQLQKQFKDALNLFKIRLNEFQNSLLELVNHSYVNDYTRSKLVVELKRIVIGNEKYILYKDVNPYFKELIEFIQNPEKWVRSKNAIFIKNEKIKENLFFDSIESNPLTEKQRDAVLVNENNNLILAGAGSGKTSVIVAKVSYLIKKNILHPNEILILAFNKNAQKELSNRFKEKGLYVKIKTFHSFGLSVISEVRGLHLTGLNSRKKPISQALTRSQHAMTNHDRIP